jgi:hypothetical protein
MISKKEIAARAYKLWEQNGQPEGRDDEDKSSPQRTPDNL